jgi:hypothetical protein
MNLPLYLGENSAPNFLIPFVTPTQGPSNYFPSRNPGIRAFKFTQRGQMLTDYLQYYFNLEETANPQWKLLYSCRELYGAADLSPAEVWMVYSCHTVIQRAVL